MLLASHSQLEALDALVEHGTLKEAAGSGVASRWALENRLKRMRERNRKTTVQLAWQRGRDSAIVQLTIWLDREIA